MRANRADVPTIKPYSVSKLNQHLGHVAWKTLFNYLEGNNRVGALGGPQLYNVLNQGKDGPRLPRYIKKKNPSQTDHTVFVTVALTGFSHSLTNSGTR